MVFFAMFSTLFWSNNDRDLQAINSNEKSFCLCRKLYACLLACRCENCVTQLFIAVINVSWSVVLMCYVATIVHSLTIICIQSHTFICIHYLWTNYSKILNIVIYIQLYNCKKLYIIV